MKKLLAAAALAMWAAGPVLALEAAKGEWTGYVTDTHCGEKGANKNHTAHCIEKCMKGGSKAQIWNEADKKAYDLDGFDKAKTLVGVRVRVKGTLDPKTNVITVESVERAPVAS